MPDEASAGDYAAMIEDLRGFLDRLSSARPSPEAVRCLREALTGWSAELDRSQVPEHDRVFGRLAGLPGRGQTMSPRLEIVETGPDGSRGTVRFGRYHLGRNGAAHGGSIPLVFDEILGQVARVNGRSLARTAYLRVDYRSITPIDRDLEISARLVSVTGRKYVVAGELRDGPVLCAEAEALFVELRPGRP
ncbi:PaaI family thioesterase [Actinocorallia longicatena]|uniref:Acyl-coenzyme A thioesterase THEM4 n=1 Tax=Actinocorallia longicatena TaxID=111803 RepID=A0ABP6QFJ1_9ACTN